MAIVTLTTDYGRQDHYAAVLKGRLLSRRPDLAIIDVSHDIQSFNIVQAAFVLGHAYQSFPDGTIHVVLVHNSSSNQDLLCFVHEGHIFLVPDNGLSTLLNEQLEVCYRIPVEDDRWRTRIASVVQALCEGERPGDIGDETRDFVKKIHLNPVVTSDLIRGAAIHIDHYDNIVFNIRRELFDRLSRDRRFELYYKRHDPVTQIHSNYYDVPVGEVACRFNHLGYLEMGINMGRAASLFGIKVDDTVQIHFLDNRS